MELDIESAASRPLGSFETAQVLTNERFAFNVVTVLSLDPGPDPEILGRAMDAMRKRHPLLRARVIENRGRFAFCLDGSLSAAPAVVPHPWTEDWRALAERELNNRFDLAAGPLFRLTCLLDPSGRVRHLILTTQHAIFDAVSGTRLLDEILIACDRLATGRPLEDFAPLSLKAAPEEYFPARFRGWRGALPLARLAGRQLAEEVALRWRRRNEPPPAADARCRIFPIELSESATTALAKRCRAERVTLNGALCAAQLIVASEHLAGRSPLYHFVFANLRPYLLPSLPPECLGSCFAMLRLATEVGDPDLWAVARRLTAQLHAASKRGDKFASVTLSRTLMRMVLTQRRYRMGDAALAYSGGSRLAEHYGELRVTALHAFVSNFVLGPPFTVNARRFLGRLWWDMVYLDSDMDQTTARRLAERVRGQLTDPDATSPGRN